jgi:hypothetical protein
LGNTDIRSSQREIIAMKPRALAILAVAFALWPATAPAPQEAAGPMPPSVPQPLDAALDRLEGPAVSVRASDAGFSWSAASRDLLLGRENAFVAAGDIRMTPLGAFGAAETRRGLVCYRADDGRSAIAYRPTASGVKEDLVLLDAAAFGTGVFGWRLDLDGLEARLEDDGSIGVYRGDGTFSGVNVCDSASAALIARAREREEKTRLVA